MQAVWKSRNTRFDNDIALPWHAPGGDDAFSFFETSQKKARS